MKSPTAKYVVLALLGFWIGLADVDAQRVVAADDGGYQVTPDDAPNVTPSACGEPLTVGCNGNEDGVWDAPLWTVTADALFLERRDPADVVWAENVANRAQSFDAGRFDFGREAGLDVSVVRRIGCANAFEFRYFGVDGWNATSTMATTPGDLLRVNAAVPVFTFTGDSLSAAYASKLHNLEINGLHQLNERLRLLAGFRYVELDEQAAMNLVNSAVPFEYQCATRNRLYGFQLGGQATLWDNCGPFTLDAVSKAGLFNNSAAQDSSYSTSLVTLPANGRGDHTAFVGEVGVTGTCHVTDHLSLRGGYRLLWINGVALASDQLPVSDFANNSGFTSSGGAFYHGAFAGLECTW